MSAREIARRLGRAASTISRELRLNASTRTYRLAYKASTAQWHAERRARRPKVAKMVGNDTDSVGMCRTAWPVSCALATVWTWDLPARSGRVATSPTVATGGG